MAPGQFAATPRPACRLQSRALKTDAGRHAGVSHCAGLELAMKRSSRQARRSSTILRCGLASGAAVPRLLFSATPFRKMRHGTWSCRPSHGHTLSKQAKLPRSVQTLRRGPRVVEPLPGAPSLLSLCCAAAADTWSLEIIRASGNRSSREDASARRCAPAPRPQLSSSLPSCCQLAASDCSSTCVVACT